MIQLICPRCGSEVVHTIVCTYPATDCYKCTNPKCDYHKDIREDLKIERIMAPE